MNAHMIDSALFKDHYGTEEMRRIFSDKALLNGWIQVETALAEAEAELGVIPQEACAEIKKQARLESFDMDRIREQMQETSHPLVPFIRQYEKSCSQGGGEYIHYGATTQDILDTAFMLQLKQAFTLLQKQLAALIQSLQEQTRLHRSSLMAGRTHGQHALPITFGFKLATYLSEFHRHDQRFQQRMPEMFVGQLSGASGTLAFLGQDGMAVRSRMMNLLGLAVPEISWHTSRDYLAEMAHLLAMTAATIGKLANEIVNLQRTEIGELEEGSMSGKVGSSTMPHKRNPMVCEYLLGLSRLVRNSLPLAHEAMIQEHERDMGLWLVEWAFLPEMCTYLSAMLTQAETVVSSMKVNVEQMEKNVQQTRGLIVSEKMMRHLGQFTGKQTAHELVYKASMRAFEQDTTLLQELCQMPEVTMHMSKEELAREMDPRAYIGLSEQFVDQVLESCRLNHYHQEER